MVWPISYYVLTKGVNGGAQGTKGSNSNLRSTNHYEYIRERERDPDTETIRKYKHFPSFCGGNILFFPLTTK